MKQPKMDEGLYDALVEEVKRTAKPEWLSYSDKDWKTVTQVFELHFHLENIINLLLTIYFLGTSRGVKSKTFREVVLEDVDFLRKLRMIQRLGWIDGKGQNVALELNNFRRDFAHPKRELIPARMKEFRKGAFLEKYEIVVEKLINLAVWEDKNYQKKLSKIFKKK